MSDSTWLLERLPAGQHGLSPSLVEENQRQRLARAAAESLAARGYGGVTTTEVVKRAGVSTSTFYKRFNDLWDCLQAAYDAAAERLCEGIETASAAAGSEQAGAAGIEAALALFAAEPPLAQLLSTEPPSQASNLWAARRRLIARLVALLRQAGERRGSGEREARLVGGALALISMRTVAVGAERLEELGPTLIEILLKP